jgi:hypothetical protein
LLAEDRRKWPAEVERDPVAAEMAADDPPISVVVLTEISDLAQKRLRDRPSDYAGLSPFDPDHEHGSRL